jgi:ABC-type cobalamin/Fe3+-siderophores transport system ATPase subunit/ABC-type Mn2+/Zn2+ transport system permease subunit
VVVAYLFGLQSPLAHALGAVGGAMGALLLLLMLAGPRAETATMLLAGLAISALAGALTTLALALAPSPFAFYDAYEWLLGSLVDRSLAQAAFAAVPSLITTLLLMRLARPLDSLTLGEEVAESLGHDINAVRLQVVCLSAVGVGACVAICGAIGFIGLVAPVFARRLNRGHPGRAIVPAALIGALLLLAADLSHARGAARARPADRRRDRVAWSALLPVARCPHALAIDPVSAAVIAEGLALPGRLERADLSLQGGQLCCLIGPNGSGKTSLLHALAGIRGSTGSVRIDGSDVRRIGPSKRQRLLTYLPASRDIAWPLTVRDLVRLGGHLEEAKIEPLLDALGLRNFGDRRTDRLSTGERSRVLIARALAPRPRLLLLDEPVSNLDPLWQLKLLDLIRAGALAQDQAVLLALHDLDLAARYADRVIVMRRGRIVADSAPASVFSSLVIAEVFGVSRSAQGWSPV